MANAPSDKTGPRITIDPEHTLVDQSVAIRADGFSTHEDITLTLSTRDSLSRTWSIEALYRADAEGRLDLARAPVANRLYQSTSYMQLFSLLRLGAGQETNGPPVFLSAFEDDLHYHLTAEGGRGHKAEAEIRRSFITGAISHSAVRSSGLWGRFFTPREGGPHPGVLVLGGAIGASLWTERVAALLAHHGYAALALTYFSTGQLPEDLVEIPLEYFSAALTWLRGQSAVDEDNIGIFAKSKGAEAALMTAARTADVECLVCYCPSAVAYQGIQSSGPIFSAHSSWIYRGQPVPFVPCYQEGKPINIQTLSNLHQIHSLNLDTSSITKPATIAVENIDAPMLLIAGEADDVWPSVRFGEMIMSRLASHNKIKGSILLTYANAGHGIDIPWLPVTAFGGGNTGAIARASLDAWEKSLEFLQEHL